MSPSLRRGRTLAELLVTLLISGIFFALLSAAFISHERLAAGATAIAEARAQQRQAQQIVPTILRAATSSDIYVVHDTLVELEYPIGTGAMCLPGSGTQAVLAPDSIAAGQRFASWSHTPGAGDLAHVFDPGALPGTRDDRWWTAVVASVSPAPNACAGSPFLNPVSDLNHTARVLAFGPWIGGSPVALPTGAVVQFTRRVRAALYASSGKHYLGYSDYDYALARWSVIQPVSGPYNGRLPGIEFQPVDSLGIARPYGLSPGPAAFGLRVRTQTGAPIRIAGMRRGPRAESLATHIALRNR